VYHSQLHIKPKDPILLNPVIESAVLRLKRTPGVVKCKILTDDERRLAMQFESSTVGQDQLLGMRITNEGIADVMARAHVALIAHSKELRHPPGPIVVIRDNGNIIGEEIWQSHQLEELSADQNAILLGKSMVLYRDALARARGRPLTLSYKALPFPELNDVDEIRDVVSVTIGSSTHIRLSQKMGWDFNNPDLGTVLVGFDVRALNRERTQNSIPSTFRL
jgi:hypothetical protein